jgi:hypothetical protein
MNEPLPVPPADPQLRSLLAEVCPVPRLGEAEVGRLASTIRARAVLPLARLRRPDPWWESAAGWLKPLVPLAAAAAVLLALALRAAEPEPPHVPAALGPAPGVESLLGSILPPAEYELLASGAGDAALLLTAALEQR